MVDSKLNGPVEVEMRFLYMQKHDACAPLTRCTPLSSLRQSNVGSILQITIKVSVCKISITAARTNRRSANPSAPSGSQRPAPQQHLLLILTQASKKTVVQYSNISSVSPHTTPVSSSHTTSCRRLASGGTKPALAPTGTSMTLVAAGSAICSLEPKR